MNANKTFTAAEYYPAELQKRIKQHSATVESIETTAAELDARLHELRDLGTITAGNAADRMAAITETKTERLALAVNRRDSAGEALAILSEIRKADSAEVTRLTEAAREREREIRHGMAEISITDPLTIARAIMDDKALLQLRGAATQAGHTQTTKSIQLVEAEQARAAEEIGRLLA